VGGKTVAQGAAAHGFGDTYGLRGLSDRLLGPTLAQMMTALDARTWIAREIARGKEILPAPGARIFVFQRRGEIDGTIAAFQILPLDDLDVAELLSEGLSKAGRQHRDVIKRAFAGNPALAGTHRDLTMIDIEIADAQAQRLNEPQAGAIEQPDDKLRGGGAGQRVEQAPNLVAGEDGGHPLLRLFCPDAVEGARELFLKHRPVEEQERAEDLRLRRGRHVLIHSQVGKKRFDFGDIHGLRMAFIVETDETGDPADVGLLRVKGVLPDAQRLTHPI